MMLLAVTVTVACGNGAQKGDNAQEGAQTEAKAKTASKTGNAKKAKNKKKKAAKRKKSVFTPASAGAPYEVLLVGGEEDFRTGAVDTLYNILTDDMPGIAQSEPLFKVSRINQAGLSKTLRLCRNIIIIKHCIQSGMPVTVPDIHFSKRAFHAGKRFRFPHQGDQLCIRKSIRPADQNMIERHDIYFIFHCRQF